MAEGLFDIANASPLDELGPFVAWVSKYAWRTASVVVGRTVSRIGAPQFIQELALLDICLCCRSCWVRMLLTEV